MHKPQNTTDIRTSLAFMLAGAVASIFAVLYQMETFNEITRELILEQVGSMQTLVFIGALQGAILAFAATFIGLKLSRRVNLKLRFLWDKSAFVWSVLTGLATAFIIVGSDRFIFSAYIPETISAYRFSFFYLMAGILYGGIIEEVLLRLFTMSLLAFAISRIFIKGKKALPGWVYVLSIVLSAALFSAGHLPFTAQIMELNSMVILRCFMLNGIGGIGFGLLYWKKGLCYSITAHACTHIFMQMLFMPLLF